MPEIHPTTESVIQINTHLENKLDDIPVTTLPVLDDSLSECDDDIHAESSNAFDLDFLDWDVRDLDSVQVGEATKYAQTVFTDKHAPSVLKLNHKQLLEDPLEEICQLAYKYPVQFLTIRQFLEKKLPFFQSFSKVAFDSLMLTSYHLLINYVSPESTNFPLLRGVPRKPCSCKSTCDNVNVGSQLNPV